MDKAEREEKVFAFYGELGKVITSAEELLPGGLKNKATKKDYIALHNYLESAYLTLHALVKEETGLHLDY